eukprot:g2696.t1
MGMPVSSLHDSMPDTEEQDASCARVLAPSGEAPRDSEIEELLKVWNPDLKRQVLRSSRVKALVTYENISVAWAGYRALPPLLGRGVGAVALLSRHDGAGDDLPAAEASLAVLVQGEPSKEELADAERGLKTILQRNILCMMKTTR